MRVGWWAGAGAGGKGRGCKRRGKVPRALTLAPAPPAPPPRMQPYGEREIRKILDIRCAPLGRDGVDGREAARSWRRRCLMSGCVCAGLALSLI